jgi:excinuclease ABC subunit B
MQNAIDETNRRRKTQVQYNQEHGIEPQTIRKAIRRGIELDLKARKTAREAIAADDTEFDRNEMIAALEKQMLEAADALEFERAASLRDRIKALKDSPDIGHAPPAGDKPGSPGRKTRRRRRGAKPQA